MHKQCQYDDLISAKFKFLNDFKWLIKYRKFSPKQNLRLVTQNTTKNVASGRLIPSNFVTFEAFHIDVVLFNAMPQAARVDPQQFRGPHLNPTGFSKGFDDHAFFNFP